MLLDLGRNDVGKVSKINSVKDLISNLIKNSEKHSKALSDTSLIRCAVNMEVVNLDHKINNEDEIAFFPPMTGG